MLERKHFVEPRVNMQVGGGVGHEKGKEYEYSDNPSPVIKYQAFKYGSKMRQFHMIFFIFPFTRFDDLVKSQKTPFFVIPAKAGIQFFQLVTEFLDSGFHRSDDFLRIHQV